MRERRAFIYFAYDLELNAIKIGMTEHSLQARMTEELSMIGAIEIDVREKHPRRLETAILFCLRKYAIHGERFYPDKKVVAFVGLALRKGVDAALRRFGDNAFEHIGLSEVFMKRFGRQRLIARIRSGHLTRHYARSAWFEQSILSCKNGTRRCGRLSDFLAFCPLQEPFDGKSHLVMCEQNGRSFYAIQKEFKNGGTEIVLLHEQPPPGFFPHHEGAGTSLRRAA